MRYSQNFDTWPIFEENFNDNLNGSNFELSQNLMHIPSRDKCSFDGLGNVSFLRVTFEMLPSGLWIFNFGSSSDLFDSIIFRFLANIFAIW